MQTTFVAIFGRFNHNLSILRYIVFLLALNCQCENNHFNRLKIDEKRAPSPANFNQSTLTCYFLFVLLFILIHANISVPFFSLVVPNVLCSRCSLYGTLSYLNRRSSRIFILPVDHGSSLRTHLHALSYHFGKLLNKKDGIVPCFISLG